MTLAALFVIFPFCMVFAALTDLVSMTIANRVSLVLAGAFLVLAPLVGLSPAEIGLHLAAGGLVLAVTFGLFALGAMGGGDAKLMAATALWMGLTPSLMSYFLGAAAIGGVFTLLVLVYRRLPLAVYTGGNLFLRNLADRSQGIPYGVALGIGGLLAYPGSPLVVAALAGLSG